MDFNRVRVADRQRDWLLVVSVRTAAALSHGVTLFSFLSVS